MWSAICTTRHERPAQGVGGRRPDGSGYVRSGPGRPWFGHKEGASQKKRQEPSDGDYVPPLSRGDRWAFLLGTMKASLLIALAFLGGLGLCIWLLTLLLH